MYNFTNKKEQTKALTDFINDMAIFRINNENGEDWEWYKSMGIDEVEDQLSGISGQVVNGKEVKDIYEALVNGLDKDDFVLINSNLNNSIFTGDGWHYIHGGF